MPPSGPLPSTPVGLYIDGAYIIRSADGRALDVVNPATGEVVWCVAEAGEREVAAAVAAAKAAFERVLYGSAGGDGDLEVGDGEASASGCAAGTSGRCPWDRRERGRVLQRMAEAMRAEAEAWAVIECVDCGKPLEEGRADITAAADVLAYYAELAEDVSKHPEKAVDTKDADVTGGVHLEPYGVVALITPWNFPLFQSVAKVAPAIAAGCAMVLKPSPLAPMTSIRLGGLAEAAGLPRGMLNVVTGGVECGRMLVDHPDVEKVSFTGSRSGGREVMAACARVPKPVALELGGKGALIVFDDIDAHDPASLATTVDWILCGIFLNAGQVCCATSRLLVHDAIADRVITAVTAAAAAIRLGDAFDPAAKMGPLISNAQADTVRRYLADAVACGDCTVRTGREQARAAALNRGPVSAYVEPIVVTDVPAAHPCWTDEIFGPFLSIRRFATEAEAVAAANDSAYGLAHGVMTRDAARARRIARRLRAGMVWVNCTAVAPTPLPFGGYKASGFGREMGVEGLQEYMQAKAVVGAARAGYGWKWYG